MAVSKEFAYYSILMKPILRFWILFLPLFLFALIPNPNAHSQAPQTKMELEESVEVDLVDLALTATNKDGNFITNLRSNEISLSEDNVPQEITRFDTFAGEKGEVPLNLAFMIDNSGSMVYEIEGLMKIDMARESALILLSELAPLDKMMVVSFDDAPKFTPLTLDRNLIGDTLRATKVRFGPTSLFDAMIATIDHLNAEAGRKVLVVCSDGLDTTSRQRMDDVLDKMKGSAELTVVVLGTVATDRMVGPYRTVVVADKGRDVLQKMADQTAGYAFFPKDLKGIERMRELIRSFIKSQYSLAYRSTNRKADGSWRNIRIACNRKGVTLRYRNGYFAK